MFKLISLKVLQHYLPPSVEEPPWSLRDEEPHRDGRDEAKAGHEDLQGPHVGDQVDHQTQDQEPYLGWDEGTHCRGQGSPLAWTSREGG